MSKNLISGLYEKIKKQKENCAKLSKVENEFINIVYGLVEFVRNNPDITNDDLKLLASTNKDKHIYFDVIFNSFPNVVKEVKKNGAKNILDMFNEKYQNGRLFEGLAQQLNTMIKKECEFHKNTLKIAFENEYMYDYFCVLFKRLPKENKTLYRENHKSKSCSGCVQYVTSVTMQEICQIVAFVKFCQENNLEEETIRNIISTNIIYDLSVINTILNNKESIKKELCEGKYGMWSLFKDYEHYKSKINDENKSI